MAHGSPDWGVVFGAVTTFPLADLAEHAVRVGSIDSSDRRGAVLFLDDFEAGIDKWSLAVTGAGAAVDLSLLGARSGLYCLRVLTSATNGQESGIDRGVGLRVLSRMGFEISAVVPSADCHWMLRLRVYTGATLYDARLRFQTLTSTLQYYDENGVFQTAKANLDVWQGGAHYNTMKLVVDPTAGKYVRAVFNGESIDLSAFALNSATSLGSPALFASSFWATQESAAVTGLMDDAIVTRDELV